MKEFEENDAVAAMRNALAACDANKYTDDDLLNLVDIIWDFYEQNGLLDIDFDEDPDDELDDIFSDLVDYATRMIRKDKEAHILPEHIETLIRAELDYEDSLEDE